MIRFLKVTKAAWIVNVILLVLSLSASMARAGNFFGFGLYDLIVPPNLVGTQISITPVSRDLDEPGFLVIYNNQPVSAKVTAAWQYYTDDQSPIYDMATYRLRGGSKVNLSQPLGSRSQAGTFTVEIPPYTDLIVEVASDGAAILGTGRAAELRLTVQSVVFPPTLETIARDTVLNTGVAASFQPARRSGYDRVASPATVFSILPALPAGLSMNSDGLITGTPTTAQPMTTYTVTAARNGETTSKDITIEIVSSVIANYDPSMIAPLVTARIGQVLTPITPVLGSSGTQALTYSVSPALPPGLTMASATGTISGTPTSGTIGTTNHTVTVTDGVTSDSKDFGVNLLGAAVVVDTSGPIATPQVVSWQAGVASEVIFTVRSDFQYIDSIAQPYISLKLAGGGPELRGTPGYPDGGESFITTAGNLGIKFSWNNPIPGTYSAETYFYTDGLVGSPTFYKVPFTLIVTGEKSDQTISFTSVAPAAVAGGATYTPVATATSGLTVAFSIDSSSTDNCQISAGVVSFLDEGLCVINADQAGDGANNGALQVQQVVEVAAGTLGTTAQTVSFTSAAPTPTLGGSDYTPTVTATSSLAVQLVGDLDSKSVCWPVGNKVILLEAGDCTVHAEQLGNFQYAPASGSQTFTVAAAPVATQALATTALSLNQVATPFTPVTIAGGVSPYEFTVQPGLPTGLSLSATTGEISGTPTALSANTTYTMTITDANGVSDSRTFDLGVTDGPAAAVAISTKGLTINRPATEFKPVTGSGGTGTLSYEIAPSLPGTLSFNSSTGAITGTPTAVMAATVYTVTVTDEASESDSQSFTLTVNPGVAASQAVASAYATADTAVTAFTPVTASGGTAPLTYSVSSTLPAGLAMSSSTGAISGTATEAAIAANYTVTVTDAQGDTDTAVFTLTVSGELVATQAVATKEVTQGAEIAAFTPVTGAGGRASLSYSVAPTLPTGLVLAPATGAITGEPQGTSAASTYTVTVTDANTATATATFSLTINSAVVATQAVASKTLSADVAATPFTPVTGTGGTGSLAYSISPSLPDGLEMDPDTGAVSGTATAGASEAVYTVTVTDAVLATATATFSLTVNGPVGATTDIAETTLSVNTEATGFKPVSGTGGTGALSYSVSPTLPLGVTMASATGTITGTPTVPTAAATYTVTVTDANNTTATAEFSLTVSTISTSISLSASNNSPEPGETVTLTATVTPGLATGLVTFKDDGIALGAAVPLSSGVATFSTSTLGNGSHTLTAEYAGSATYDGSTSNAVTVSLLSPSSEFDRNSEALSKIVQDLALSSLTSQVQNAGEAARSATGRMIDNSSSGSDIVVSSKGTPLAFHGDLNYADGDLDTNSNFLGEKVTESGTKRRLVYGTLGVSKTDGGTTSALLNATIAWEWSASEKAVLGYWLGLDAGRSEISSSFGGSQTSLGLGAGMYGIGQLGESIYVSGFASLGQDKRMLELGNTILDLTSDYATNSQIVGTALTGSIKTGRVELRPEFGFSYGRMNIGSVDFEGVAYEQTDSALSMDLGVVSVATVNFSPEVIVKSFDETTSLALTPRLECQKVIANSPSSDCGGGGSLMIEHRSLNGNTRYLAKVRSQRLSDVTETSIELNMGLQF